MPKQDFNKVALSLLDEVVNILEKVNDTVLPKRVTQRDKWISQQAESLVKNKVTLRNKYRNHRNLQNYDNWRETAKLTDESFDNRIYSDVRI